jgi:hypothetical protein
VVLGLDDQEVNFVTAEVSPRNVKNVVNYRLNSWTAGTNSFWDGVILGILCNFHIYHYTV